MQGLVIGLALGSSFGSAVSTTLKKASASRAPAVTGGGLRGLAAFVRATAASPLWLGAVLADLAGVGLQVTALHFGGLALVQPILISGLLFALLLRHVGAWRLSAREVGWGLLVAGSLIAFLVLSGAVTGVQGTRADRADAIIAASGAAAGVLICVVTAHRNVPPAGRAALLGVAVGAVYATTAALIKAATTVLADHGLLALVTSWQLYAALVVAAGGLFLAQVTFQAGPLTASLPAISTVDPLLSVLIGVVVYNERLRHGPVGGAVLAVLLVILVVAVLGLSRVEAADSVVEPPAGQGSATAARDR
jgi:hypothetical protein